jgi:acyl-CoA synthetase (NDP forming)
MFLEHGVVIGGDFDEMIDLATGFLACSERLPRGPRVAIVSSSGGGGVWMADACARAGLDVPELDAATRAAIDVHLPSYGTSQNPIDTTAQGVHQLGYAAFAHLAVQSPLVDGVIVVVTARHANFLIKDQPRLLELARDTQKPVLMWSYTLPAEKSVAILNEAGYPLFTNAETCARTMRALADYRMVLEGLHSPGQSNAAE